MSGAETARRAGGIQILRRHRRRHPGHPYRPRLPAREQHPPGASNASPPESPTIRTRGAHSQVRRGPTAGTDISTKTRSCLSRRGAATSPPGENRRHLLLLAEDGDIALGLGHGGTRMDLVLLPVGVPAVWKPATGQTGTRTRQPRHPPIGRGTAHRKVTTVLPLPTRDGAPPPPQYVHRYRKSPHYPSS